MIVITDPNFSEIRYFKIGQILPRQDAMSALLAAPEVWTTKPAWTGRIAPGGAWEPALIKYASFAAWWHKYLSKVPNVVWVMLSGAVMNVVLNLFHSKGKKDEAAAAAAPSVALTREQQRAALKERSVPVGDGRCWSPVAGMSGRLTGCVCCVLCRLAKEKREKEAAEKEEADRLELARLEAERVAKAKADEQAEATLLAEREGSTATKPKTRASKRK